MSIHNDEHHEQGISNSVNLNFKVISNAAIMKKSENIQPAKIISIGESKPPLDYQKSLHPGFPFNAHDVFVLSEFLPKESPIDHLMFLKNFCS
jgi:hypothetical protein